MVWTHLFNEAQGLGSGPCYTPPDYFGVTWFGHIYLMRHKAWVPGPVITPPDYFGVTWFGHIYLMRHKAWFRALLYTSILFWSYVVWTHLFNEAQGLGSGPCYTPPDYFGVTWFGHIYLMRHKAWVPGPVITPPDYFGVTWFGHIYLMRHKAWFGALLYTSILFWSYVVWTHLLNKAQTWVQYCTDTCMFPRKMGVILTMPISRTSPCYYQ